MTNPIRSYREKHGLTLEAFGQLVGAQKGTVHRWEHGIAPSIASARSIEQQTEGAITRQQLRPDVWASNGMPVALAEGTAA